MQVLTTDQKKQEFKYILKGLVLIVFISLLSNLISMDCNAQSTQEINRQQHQQEVMRQQQQILQQQYIQTQQLEHMRRDAEFRVNSDRVNRTHEHLHQPRY